MTQKEFKQLKKELKKAFKIGGLETQPKSYRRLRHVLLTPHDIYRPRERVYLTNDGFAAFAEGRIYNEDDTAFMLFGRGDFNAMVMVETGEIVFLGKKDMPWRIEVCTNIYTSCGFMGDEPLQIFEEMPAEPTGCAAEFIRHFEDNADA